MTIEDELAEMARLKHKVDNGYVIRDIDVR